MHFLKLKFSSKNNNSGTASGPSERETTVVKEVRNFPVVKGKYNFIEQQHI